MKAFNKCVCLYAAPRLLFMLQLPLQKTTYNKINLIIFHCMREHIMDDESIGAVFPQHATKHGDMFSARLRLEQRFAMKASVKTSASLAKMKWNSLFDCLNYKHTYKIRFYLFNISENCKETRFDCQFFSASSYISLTLRRTRSLNL